MVDIRRITVAEFFEKAWPLLVAHREELTTNKDLMVLKPARPVYDAIEQVGCLLVLAAYDGDEMVGYSANILAPNMHYADVFQCQNDVLFTTPSARGRTGLDLIAATEKAARESGCQVVLWHAKPGTALDKLMQAKGVRVQDIVYMKELG